MKEITFNGFNREIFTFFRELSLNNNKEWFDKNRDFYDKEIKNKSKLFVMALHEEYQKIKLDYIADPKLSLFRINRDIRFSKNKDPYKTNLGMFFQQGTKDSLLKKAVASGIYIHYEINESFAATGLHSPEPNILKLLRKHISENWDDFSGIIENEDFKNEFPFTFDNDNLLKKVQGYTEDNPAFQWLRRKEFTFYDNIPLELFYTRELVDYTVKKSEISYKLSLFLNEVFLQI